ncbi:hypothetical protein GW17_00057402 [Ensete ventricosum]|nr:hypothetical protein GW17_00057402 [Ensete ventricosum]
MARPQGATDCGCGTHWKAACRQKHRPTHGGAARGSSIGRRGGHPLVGRLPTGKGSRRLRKGSGIGAVRVREEG